MSIATKEGLASRSRKGIRLGPVAGVSLGFEASPPCRGVPAARVGAILVGRLCDPSPSVRSSRSRPNCTSGALTGQGMLGLYVAFPHWYWPAGTRARTRTWPAATLTAIAHELCLPSWMLWFTLSLELNTLVAGSTVSCNYQRCSPRRERRQQGEQRRAQSPSDAGARAVRRQRHARWWAAGCVASCRARAPARRIASPFQCHCHTPREALAGPPAPRWHAASPRERRSTCVSQWRCRARTGRPRTPCRALPVPCMHAAAAKSYGGAGHAAADWCAPVLTPGDTALLCPGTQAAESRCCFRKHKFFFLVHTFAFEITSCSCCLFLSRSHRSNL